MKVKTIVGVTVVTAAVCGAVYGGSQYFLQDGTTGEPVPAEELTIEGGNPFDEATTTPTEPLEVENEAHESNLPEPSADNGTGTTIG